ncbi:hypothetical protein Nepgr_001727 [Nepenthes gracilis]|uniref:Uncharacterized protein n=1 Tax=Nepenthes gracilis TaxID=150966 RepID=A0AAD3P7P4_NEPGR|nr:hypothetical protein Nepgr_001727 [Nepenthes gracilis]
MVLYNRVLCLSFVGIFLDAIITNALTILILNMSGGQSPVFHGLFAIGIQESCGLQLNGEARMSKFVAFYVTLAVVAYIIRHMQVVMTVDLALLYHDLHICLPEGRINGNRKLQKTQTGKQVGVSRDDNIQSINGIS